MTLSVVKKGLLVALVCTAFGAVHTVKAAADGGQGHVAPGGRIPGGGEAKVDQQAGNGLWNGVCTYKKSITASAFALTGGSAVAYAKFYMFPQASEVVKKAGFQKFLVDQFKLIFTNSSRADKVFGTLVACALLSGGLLVGETSYDLSGWAKNWLAQGKGVDQAPAPAPIVQPAAPALVVPAPIRVPGGLPAPAVLASAPAASEVNLAAPVTPPAAPAPADADLPVAPIQVPGGLPAPAVIVPADPVAPEANPAAPVTPPAAAPQPSVHSAAAAINAAVVGGGLAAPAAPAGPLATTPVQTRVDLGTAGGAGTSAGLPTGLDSPSHRPAIPEGVSVAARLALAAGEPGVDAHDDAAVGAGSAEAAHVAPVTPVAEAPLVDTPVQPRVAPGAGGAGVRRTSVTRGTDGAPETVVSSGRRGSESAAHAAAAAASAAAGRRNSADAAAVPPARTVTLSEAYRFTARRREARRGSVASATSARSSVVSSAGEASADDVVVLPTVPAPSAAVAAAAAVQEQRPASVFLVVGAATPVTPVPAAPAPSSPTVDEVIAALRAAAKSKNIVVPDPVVAVAASAPEAAAAVVAKTPDSEATAASTATSTSPSSESSDGSDSSKSARGGRIPAKARRGRKEFVPANHLLTASYPPHHGISGSSATPGAASSRSSAPAGTPAAEAPTTGPRTATGPVRIPASGARGAAPAAAAPAPAPAPASSGGASQRR